MSDSTEKRVLSINPDLFKVSKNNNTRKNKPPSEKPAKIKIRDPMKTHVGNSRTLKRNLLNYIRKQQDLKSKTMFQDKEVGGHAARRVAADEILDKDENSHFKESLDFLTNLTNEKERREKMEKTHNQTLKRHESLDKFESNLYNLPHTNTVENVHLTFPPDIKGGIRPEAGPAIPWKHYPPPTHGCLKNGSLPTYRTWKNQTQKNYGTAPPTVSVPATSGPAIYAPPPVPLAQKTPEDIKNERMQMKLQEIQQRIAAMKNRVLVNENQPVENAEKSDRDAVKTAQSHQMPAFPRALGKKVAGFVNKQRKTIRRTYQVGKSKRAPKVSVLISNKTIRKNVLTKTHLLHQVPIHDVKKYLVKKGFIRVGTPAPTDVLRKMYESALLMCGEIENHNPDNLLYNFMHAEHDLGNK